MNYSFRLEREIIAEQESHIFQFLLYLMLYGLAYYGTLFIYCFTKKVDYFNRKEILLKSFIALLLISFDRAFAFSSELFQTLSSFSEAESIYLVKIINLVIPSIAYILVIYFIKTKYDSSSNCLYGISLSRFDIRPYFYMLLCMLPLLILASFRNDFTQQYPFFKYWKYEPGFGLSRIQLFSLYELFYLGNFINIELLFRGLLVIGMVRMMGKDAILPMVVTYAFLHFGKPLPETISSIFGGYILGIFAYKTENIVGGIFIHMAIALLMDVFAIWQLQ